MLLLSFSDHALAWWSSCKCMILSLTTLSYSLPLISISRSTLWPWLKGTLTSCSTWSSSHFGALATSVNHVIHSLTTAESRTLTSVHTCRKAISILLSRTAAVQHLCGNSVRGGRVLGLYMCRQIPVLNPPLFSSYNCFSPHVAGIYPLSPHRFGVFQADIISDFCNFVSVLIKKFLATRAHCSL